MIRKISVVEVPNIILRNHLVDEVLNSVGEESWTFGVSLLTALLRLNYFVSEEKMRGFAICRVRVFVNLATFLENGVNILSRFSQFKTILKSIIRITFSVFFWLSMRFRKTCAAISAPRLVPQPICVPWKSIRRWTVAKELTHFEHIPRSVFPTAIGRTPLSFFRRPITFITDRKRSQP